MSFQATLLEAHTEDAARTAAAQADDTFYHRLVEAVRLYEDAAWVAEHFRGDTRAAANFLEEKYFPRLWQSSRLDFARLREVLRRFPDLADWQPCAFSPARLSDQMEAEERERAQRAEQQRRESARQADWQACQAYVDQGLRDGLLLHIRDGNWHPTYDLGSALEERIDPALARRRYVLDNGEDDREAGMIAHGKSLLIEDAIRQAEDRKLVVVEDRGDAGRFIRSTPWKDARFALDDEFARWLPRSPAEIDQLEAQLLKEGCLEALVVWKEQGILINGYTRYGWCMLLGRTPRIVELSFPDRSAVKKWIWVEHLARRNLSPEAKSYGRGALYNALRIGHSGGDHTSRKAKLQNATVRSALEDLAQKHHVNRVTIYRDSRFQLALDHVAQVCAGDIRDRVLTRELKWTRGDVERLAKLEDDAMRAAVQQALQTGKRPALPRNRAKAAVRLPAGSRQSRVQALIAYLGEKEAGPFSRLLARTLANRQSGSGPMP
jgi:hypothetical protein